MSSRFRNSIWGILSVVPLGVVFSIMAVVSNQRQRVDPDLSSDALPTPSVVFVAGTEKNSKRAPEDVFRAPEIVHAIVEFPTLIKGTHRLDAAWIRPDGNIEEFAPVTLRFPAEGGRQANFWIRFHDEQDRFGAFRRAMGSRIHYNGDWLLEIRSGKRVLAREVFAMTDFR